MTFMLNRRRAQLAMLAAALPGSHGVRADDFPSRPVRLIVPVGAGASGDVIMRVLGEQLATHIKQPVVIENRPGADGIIATQSLLSAPADGHSMILIGPQQMVFNPLLRNDLPYKVGDVRPLCGVVRGFTALVTGADSPFTTYESFVAAARKAPEAVSIGTDVLSFRVGAVLLGQAIGADLNQVRYKAASQMLSDLAGNQLNVSLLDTGRVGELAKSGKVRVLAISSKERSQLLPQVPTMRERGTDFVYSFWTGLGVRSGTPEAATRRLEEDLQKALHSAEFRGFLAKLGGVLELSPMSAQAVSAEVASDTQRYQPVMKRIASELEVEKR